MDKFYYSKRGRQVFGPYESFMEAKEAAGVHRSWWYERRLPAAGTYVYHYYSSWGTVVVGERQAMLDLDIITRSQARIPALERKEAAAQNSQLQSALAAAERANEQLATSNLTLQREAADLRRKNAELVRRLQAIRSAVEALG